MHTSIEKYHLQWDPNLHDADPLEIFGAKSGRLQNTLPEETMKLRDIVIRLTALNCKVPWNKLMDIIDILIETEVTRNSLI